MPAIFINSYGQLKSILELLELSEPCNWLVSYLECYDTVGWEGCEKWDKRVLILTDEELKNDVYLRDMQFIWGAFSAIPKRYNQDDILSYKLPELEIPDYMGNYIVPQHPLAILEIAVCDGGYTYISSKDESFLSSLYRLPCNVIDAEAYNRIMNKELCRIQDKLREFVPNVSEEVANDVQWRCWHSLFKNSKTEVSDNDLERDVRNAYEKASAPGYHFSSTIWDPYKQQ